MWSIYSDRRSGSMSLLLLLLLFLLFVRWWWSLPGRCWLSPAPRSGPSSWSHVASGGIWRNTAALGKTRDATGRRRSVCFTVKQNAALLGVCDFTQIRSDVWKQKVSIKCCLQSIGLGLEIQLFVFHSLHQKGALTIGKSLKTTKTIY